MSHHSYIYSPAAESQLTKRRMRTDAVLAVITVVVFAAIGVLLAWRG